MKKAVATITALMTLFTGASVAFAGPVEPPDWLDNGVHQLTE